MSLSYTWEFLNKEVATIANAVRSVTWICTATDLEGNSASIKSSTVFDVAAAIFGGVEPLTNERSEFIEQPTDQDCLQWVINVHKEESRALALEALFKKELYGDEDDLISPPPQNALGE